MTSTPLRVLLLSLTVVWWAGCNLVLELEDPPVECGDGMVHGDEICDTDDLAGQTCISRGFTEGVLTCAADCRGFVTTLCGPPTTCGNGTLQTPESCDGTDLEQATCESLGYYGGTLGCGADCRYDLTDCAASGRCGDGVSQGLETCDGTDLGGATCESLGYYGGELACAETCAYDTTDCATYGICGDDVRQDDLEECDGVDVGGLTCQELGYSGGTIGCTQTCAIDASGCFYHLSCGDSVIQSPETCDGTDLNGQTCLTMGFYAGTLMCLANCTFDLTNCALYGHCGDNLRQEAHEECDGEDLGQVTCSDLGFYGGELTCGAGCLFDTTGCQAFGWCGDGVRDATNLETCDGTDLGGVTCEGLGFYGGVPFCDGACGLDLSDCEAAGRCGDGVIQGGFGETCDGTDFDGADCTTLGHGGGTLTCDGTCTYDLTGCTD